MLNCINFMFKKKRDRSVLPEEMDTVVPTNKTNKTNKTKILPYTELNKKDCSICYFYGTCDKSKK